MEGTDVASFNFNATTRQISTKTGVTYDYEEKTSYEVTIKVTDGTDSDTVVVTIDVEDLPTVSIEAVQERVLLSDGAVKFKPSSDPALAGIGLKAPVVVTQDHVWAGPSGIGLAVEKFFDEETWAGYTPFLLRDAPVQGGDFTVTLQPGDDWELDPATSSATVEIVAADPLVTVRAEEAGYSVAENFGTLTVTLIAETVVGAPKPQQNTAVIAWAAVADEGTGGGSDFRDAGAIRLSFTAEQFTEEGGRWVLERDVEVTVVNDSVWELNEEFHIALSRFVEDPPNPSFMHRLVKLANPDRTLCEDLASGVNCGRR